MKVEASCARLILYKLDSVIIRITKIVGDFALVSSRYVMFSPSSGVRFDETTAVK